MEEKVKAAEDAVRDAINLVAVWDSADGVTDEAVAELKAKLEAVAAKIAEIKS